MDRISATLQQFIDLHETGISVGVSRSRESSAQAEAVTEQLVLLALVFGIALGRLCQLYGSAPAPPIAEPYQTDRTGQFPHVAEYSSPERVARPRRCRELDGHKATRAGRYEGGVSRPRLS